MATIKELITRFGFEIDDKGLKDLESGISAAKDGILGLGVVMGGAAISLFGLVKSTADAKDELYKMSQRLGIEVEQLRQLSFMGKISGMSMDEMGLSLTFLNRNLENAKNGAPDAAKAFRQVGISGEMLRSGGVKADTALKILGERFATLPDGPKKVALAMEIFGRSGARMIPFLNRYTHGLTPLQQKVMAMGATTKESAEMGEEFNDSLHVMQVAIASVGKTVGTGLLPVAKEIVEQITKWIVENKDLIKTNLTGFVNALTASLKFSIKIADIFIKSLSGLANGLGGAETATKMLLMTFSILSGASLLIGIGKLVQAVVVLGNSLAIANLKAAAIPALIGAAVVALFLIMEDIYSFFTGKDSFLGDLLSILPEIGKAFSSIFDPIFEPFVNAITMITDGFGDWKDVFKELGVLVVNVLLMPIRLIVSSVAGFASVVGRIFNNDALKSFAAGAQEISDKIKLDSRMPGASITGVTPQDAVGAGGKQVANRVDVKQEFNFPPGTDPLAVGDKIASKATDGFDDVLRATSFATSNGGAN